MFLASVVPGILLALAYVGAIWFMGRFTPGFVGGRDASEFEPMPWGEIAAKTLPILGLIVVVLGGIYTGWLTPVEAGAAGAALGLAIALIHRKMSVKLFWDALLETGHVTAAILFLITAASIHSRMLGLAGLPNELGERLATSQASFFAIMVICVVMMLFPGTLLDTASIILIVVPLFLPLIDPMGLSLVWFGIVTMVGAEIGLLTPPLGISCFVIKATLDDDRITLKDVFLGALPFAAVMLTVLILLIRFPALSLAIPNEEDAPMRTVTADNITEVFTSYFGEDTDPRVRDVLAALAQHICDFVLETRLTHDEWRKGLEFLEGAGRIPDPERNEFILLSDVNGPVVAGRHGQFRARGHQLFGARAVPCVEPASLEDRRRHEARFRGRGGAGRGHRARHRRRPGRRRRDRHLADRAQRHVFEPGSGAGRAFVPCADDHGCDRPLRLHHGEAGELHIAQ